MNFNLTKPLPQAPLLLRGYILIAEEDNAPLRNQQGELVFLLVRQVFELQADDLRADVDGQVADLLRGSKQMLLGLVGARGWVDVRTVIVSHGIDLVKIGWFLWLMGVAL